MFHRILIANRGEIALRVLKTARKMGITTVAAYSEADKDGSWLDEADERVCIGPAPAKSSYLDPVALVQAAVDRRCTAIHPGYGFLAENPLFASLCQQAGIKFIGPSPRILEILGAKSPAKRLLADAGLKGVPGSQGSLHDLDEARAVAEEIGYPVLLKAEAGGGGRGMRRIEQPSELEAGWNDARREAQAAFGNPAMLIEKYIERPRHIEFQVLADRWGNAAHVYERECSIQRNHQKLVEECPSPALDSNTRASVGAAVAQAVAAIGYEGAGTVEFLLTPDGALYFIEMNARLQVEHPVTECVSGLDLVEWQLRIAAGQVLDIDLPADPKGHAIEVRINAEDPDHDFRPAPGTVTTFDVAVEQGPGSIRVDSHLRDGARIPPHYDSMVAKIIAHGSDRAEAITTMANALKNTTIEGVPTTLALHQRILEDDSFKEGALHTGFLVERALINTNGAQ